MGKERRGKRDWNWEMKYKGMGRGRYALNGQRKRLGSERDRRVTELGVLVEEGDRHYTIMGEVWSTGERGMGREGEFDGRMCGIVMCGEEGVEGGGRERIYCHVCCVLHKDVYVLHSDLNVLSCVTQRC